MLLKKLKCRLRKPFTNNKGFGYFQLLMWMVGTFSLVSFLSWFVVSVMHLRTENLLNTMVYNISDAIAETGKLSTEIQTEFHKKFNETKFYTGDYEVTYYKYDYSNGFSKTMIGKSVNGANVPEQILPKDSTIQVVFKSTGAVPLDNISNILSPNPINAGIAVESGGKVN